MAPFIGALLRSKIGYEFRIKVLVRFSLYLFISSNIVKTWISKVVENKKDLSKKKTGFSDLIRGKMRLGKSKKVLNLLKLCLK